MTDDTLRYIAEFYNEVQTTARASSFLRNCSSFGLCSGTRQCDLPKGLQKRIIILIESYYKELEEEQKEL